MFEGFFCGDLKNVTFVARPRVYFREFWINSQIICIISFRQSSIHASKLIFLNVGSNKTMALFLRWIHVDRRKHETVAWDLQRVISGLSLVNSCGADRPKGCTAAICCQLANVLNNQTNFRVGQQAPCPTFCARPTIKRTSSLALPLPARF